MGGSAAGSEGDLVGVGPSRHVRGAHALLPGEIGQGPAAVNVLFDEPVAVDGSAGLVVLRAVAERDAVLLGEVGQYSAGEAGKGGDLLQRAVFVEVEAGERLFRHFLSGCEANVSCGSGYGLRRWKCGGGLCVQGESDGFDAGAEDLGSVADGIPALPDKLVQMRDVDAGRVGAGQVEAVQQGCGRMPGHTLVADVLSREECPSFFGQLVGQFWGLQSCETDGLGPEVGVVEIVAAWDSVGGQPADALEEQAANQEFTAAAAGGCAGASADVLPVVVR